MNKRPRIKIPLTALDYILEIVALLVVLATIILYVVYWIFSPEEYSIKILLLFTLPITSIFIYAMLTILNKYPHIFNFPVNVTEENAFFLYKTATRMMRWIKLLCCLLFAYIVWVIAKEAITYQEFGLDVIFWLLIASTIIYPIFMIVRIIKYDKKLKK